MKREEERKSWEKKCKELSDKNENFMKQVTGQLLVQGAKNITWDVIIDEEKKLRPYLDYILDKEIVMQETRQSVTVVKEVLNKNPIDTTNNTIDFLNGLTEDYLKAANIKDKISVIKWAKKVVNKHQDLDTVQEKIDIMTHQVKMFTERFMQLFKRGLPFFWEEKGSMFYKKEYHDRLVSCKLDHRKF